MTSSWPDLDWSVSPSGQTRGSAGILLIEVVLERRRASRGAWHHLLWRKSREQWHWLDAWDGGEEEETDQWSPGGGGSACCSCREHESGHWPVQSAHRTGRTSSYWCMSSHAAGARWPPRCLLQGETSHERTTLNHHLKRRRNKTRTHTFAASQIYQLQLGPHQAIRHNLQLGWSPLWGSQGGGASGRVRPPWAQPLGKTTPPLGGTSGWKVESEQATLRWRLTGGMFGWQTIFGGGGLPLQRLLAPLRLIRRGWRRRWADLVQFGICSDRDHNNEVRSWWMFMDHCGRFAAMF